MMKAAQAFIEALQKSDAKETAGWTSWNNNLISRR
jgi:hypothetical protein